MIKFYEIISEVMILISLCFIGYVLWSGLNYYLIIPAILVIANFGIILHLCLVVQEQTLDLNWLKFQLHKEKEEMKNN